MPNTYKPHLRTPSNAPRPQRQSLNPHNRGLDVPPESNHSNEYAQNIHNVVSIPRDRVETAAVSAPVLVRLASAHKRLGDWCAFEEVGFGWVRGWKACCGGEHVDGFEDEVARECAAEV